MKKIGILTLQGLYNYGNRLQNYAVQEIIRRYGYEGESLVIKDTGKEKIIKIIAFIIESKTTNPIRYFHRFYNFWKFNKKYIKIKKLKKLKVNYVIKKRYSFLALGGDQIWNQKWNLFNDLDELGFQFGSFIEPEKRIPFSPSFGENDIPDKKKEYCKKWLNEIKHLAIREVSGAKIINELTGKKAEVLIDPVMMLTIDEWKKIFAHYKKSDEEFLLTCFLGGSDTKRKQCIEKIVHEKKLKIKEVGRYEDKESWVGPDGFLSLLWNSKIVCTDSFHCVAFAILFKKPFIVFDRKNCDISQMTRLENIMKLFNLSDRHIDKINLKNIFEIDYSDSDYILDIEREKFNKFLQNWLK